MWRRRDRHLAEPVTRSHTDAGANADTHSDAYADAYAHADAHADTHSERRHDIYHHLDRCVTEVADDRRRHTRDLR
jgi:hypothetical protein